MATTVVSTRPDRVGFIQAKSVRPILLLLHGSSRHHRLYLYQLQQRERVMLLLPAQTHYPLS